MKAAVYYENGAPSVFRYEEVPDPVAGPGEMLMQRRGRQHRGRRHAEPARRSAGERAPRRRLPGRRHRRERGTRGRRGTPSATAWSASPSTARTPNCASRIRSRPGRSRTDWRPSWPPACPSPTGRPTTALFEFGRLVEGETALIHAGAGGVGLAAIQMAQRAGARVLATASSDERLERLRAFGLDDGINYREKDFVTEVRALTNNRGADVILDSVGGENLQKSLACAGLSRSLRHLRQRGTRRGDQTGHVDAGHVRIRASSAISSVAELFVGPRAHSMIAQLLDDVASGELRVEIDRRFALADAEEAHAYIESRQAFGRVVLLTE